MSAQNEQSVSAKREIATMLKQGFIPDSAMALSPARTPRLPRSPASSPSRKLPSPPPSFPKKIRSPSLQEMMAQESWSLANTLEADRVQRLQERVARIVAQVPIPAVDVKLTISSNDGFKVSMGVHRAVLAEKSRFFAEKLNENGAHLVKICECDDVEVYVETVVLMYCEDLGKRLVEEEVGKVLGLLKVSAAIKFEAGIMSCLEYLEAVPWSKDEEEKVVYVLEQLQLHDPIQEVLQRVLVEPSSSAEADDIFLHLLTGILQAKNEKAGREMKTLLSGLLKEGPSHSSHGVSKRDVSRDTLYSICHKCLNALLLCLSVAAGIDENRRDRGALMAEVAREADNMQWIVAILIEEKLGDEFVRLWADQRDLASLHSKIPVMYRFGISKITAQLCIAVGRRQLLVPKDARFSLLQTWLEALYEDFGWMRRACRSIDKKLIEDGLSQTILTLPMVQQQAILLN
ncbi:BTB/POZ domain-containing protein At5g60050-like [Aristolochia californica]|uniref:BTB/POZ domain-containing protein At5g60050-like n=1 Tax=Aristolochia californica TaxID=171875 RepID=UPI0035DFEF61